MQTMKKQSTKTTRMRMTTTTTVQLLLMATVAFFELVHVFFLRKSPVDLTLVVSAASVRGVSRKSENRAGD